MMTDITAEAERGDPLRDGDDSDARLRAALEKDRQRAQQVRRDARATFRAMEGWRRVRSVKAWRKICADSQDQYEAGQFLLERLGAERYLDPKLMATILSLPTARKPGGGRKRPRASSRPDLRQAREPRPAWRRLSHATPQ